jgi:hypothetical protein
MTPQLPVNILDVQAVSQLLKALSGLSTVPWSLRTLLHSLRLCANSVDMKWRLPKLLPSLPGEIWAVCLTIPVLLVIGFFFPDPEHMPTDGSLKLVIVFIVCAGCIWSSAIHPRARR